MNFVNRIFVKDRLPVQLVFLLDTGAGNISRPPLCHSLQLLSTVDPLWNPSAQIPSPAHTAGTIA